MLEQLKALTLQSEKSLQACESWRPQGPPQTEYIMCLPAERFLHNTTKIKLIAVTHPEDWQKLYALRQQVETAFGLNDPEIIRTLIQDIQSKQKNLNGQWYLAQNHTGDFVGEIGYIPIESPWGTLGRLQDVDIAPNWQGQGLGTALIAAFCQIARTQKLQGLLLMALQNDWPWQWYEKLGFEHIGVNNGSLD